ncbi:hypothetical protein BGP_6613 [Beggiatoa sp. PS]|nr:hypothetical protein BGP_6613 [Beggiatoa sp. PS]
MAVHPQGKEGGDKQWVQDVMEAFKWHDMQSKMKELAEKEKKLQQKNG